MTALLDRAPDLDAVFVASDLMAQGALAVPLVLRHEGRELSFFSTVATFGTAVDVTVAELSIEAFFPADAETAAFLHQSLPQT